MSGNLNEDLLRKKFAKALALQAFGNRAKGFPKSSRKPVNEQQRALWARAGRSAKLIAGELNHRAVLYSLGTEQARALSTMIHNTIPRIDSVCTIYSQEHLTDESLFLRAIVSELEKCLWKCDVYIGVVQPGSESMKYLAASEHSEMLNKVLKRQKKKGISFQCIDTEETAIVGYSSYDQIFSKKDSSSSSSSLIEEKTNQNETASTTSSSTNRTKYDETENLNSPIQLGKGLDLPLVVVPLQCEKGGACLGVISVDHFVAPLSFFANDQQAILELKQRQMPFLNNDDAAIKNITLYRAPETRNAVVEILPLDVSCAAYIIKGKVVFINRGNKAVGPVYTVSWEDGLRETSINTRTMLLMLASTPRSLGQGTPITPQVVDFLEEVARKVGDVLYRMRTRRTLSALVSTGYVALLPAREAWQAAGKCVLEALPRARAVEVWEVKYPITPNIEMKKNHSSKVKKSVQLSSSEDKGKEAFASSTQVDQLKEEIMPTINIVARCEPNNVFRTMNTTRKPSEIPFKKRSEFFELLRLYHQKSVHASARSSAAHAGLVAAAECLKHDPSQIIFSASLAAENAALFSGTTSLEAAQCGADASRVATAMLLEYEDEKEAKEKLIQKKIKLNKLQEDETMKNEENYHERYKQEIFQTKKPLSPIKSLNHLKNSTNKSENVIIKNEKDVKNQNEFLLTDSELVLNQKKNYHDEMNTIENFNYHLNKLINNVNGINLNEESPQVHTFDQTTNHNLLGTTNCFTLPCAEIGHPVLLAPFYDEFRAPPTSSTLDKETTSSSNDKSTSSKQHKSNAPSDIKKFKLVYFLAVTLRAAPVTKASSIPQTNDDNPNAAADAGGGGSGEDSGEITKLGARVAAAALRPLDLLHIQNSALELSKALGYTRGRDSRAEGRRVALVQARKLCAQWEKLEATALTKSVLKLMTPHLVGANIYFGLLEPGGDVIKYGVSTDKSGMSGRTLNRGIGISFTAVDESVPIVVRDPDYYGDLEVKVTEGLKVDVLYAKRYYPASVGRNRGRGCFDIAYDNGDKEAGVPLERIRTHRRQIPSVHPFFPPKLNPSSTGTIMIPAHGWPYLCAPLINGEMPIGIVGIDGFERCARSHSKEEHPETGVPEWVMSIGSYLGEAVDKRRKMLALERISEVTRDFNATTDHIGITSLEVLAELIIHTHAIRIFEGNFNFSEWSPVNTWSHQQQSQVFQNQVQVPESYLRESWDKAVAELSKSAVSSSSKSAKMKDLIKKAEALEEYPEILVGRVSDFGVYAFLKNAPPPLLKAFGMTAEYANELSKLDEVRFTICVRRFARASAYSEDVHFFNEVCRVMESSIQIVNGRLFRHEARKHADIAIHDICKQWKAASDLDELISQVVAVLSVPLTGCCVYVGSLCPGANLITYTHASSNSKIVGKKLKRHDSRRKWQDNPLSFDVVDTGRKVLIKTVEDERSAKLHYFGPKKKQGWPFVSVPLSRGSCVWGVLCVDSFESCGRGRPDDEVPEPGVVDFITSAGLLLGSALDLKHKSNTLSDLDDCTKDPELGLAKLWQLAISALQQNILFTSDISILRLSKKQFPELNQSPSSPYLNLPSSPFGASPSSSPFGSSPFNAMMMTENNKTDSSSEFPSLCLMVNVVRAVDLPKIRKFGKNNAYVTVSWDGIEVGRSRVVLNSLSPEFNDEIVISNVSNWSKTNLLFTVWDSNITSSDSIIGEFSITGGFVAHLRSQGNDVFPLRQVWTDRDSNSAGYLEANLSLHVAEFAMPVISTIPPPVRVIRVTIYGAHGLAIADDTGSSDPYCVVYFDDEEIGRTPIIFETLNPIWKDCVYEIEAPEDALQSELVIDVYDYDEEGDHDFLGKVELSGADLTKPKPGRVTYTLQVDKSIGSAPSNKGGGGLFSKAQAMADDETEDSASTNANPNPIAASSRTNKFVKGKLELELSYEFKSVDIPSHKKEEEEKETEKDEEFLPVIKKQKEEEEEEEDKKNPSRRQKRGTLLAVNSSMGLSDKGPEVDLDRLQVCYVDGIVNDESSHGQHKRSVNGGKVSANSLVSNLGGEVIQMSERRRGELLNCCLIGRTTTALPFDLEKKKEEIEATYQQHQTASSSLLSKNKQTLEKSKDKNKSSKLKRPIQTENDIGEDDDEDKDAFGDEVLKLDKTMKLQEKQKIEEESFCGLWSKDTILSPIKDISLKVNQQLIGQEDGTDHVIVLRGTEKKIFPEDVSFMSSVAVKVQSAIRCIRGRVMRDALRKQVSQSIINLCSKFTLPAFKRKSKNESISLFRGGLYQDKSFLLKTSHASTLKKQQKDDDNDMKGDNNEDVSSQGFSSPQNNRELNDSKESIDFEDEDEKVTDIDSLFRITLSKLSTSLPGANLYIALLQPGGNELRFVAATENSSMLGRSMLRGENKGVCFDCVGPHFKQKGVVVNEKSALFPRVRCFEEEDRQRAAEQSAASGESSYIEDDGDDDEERKKQDDAENIPKALRGGAGGAGKGIWPFIAVPLSHGGCSVGVLCCDDFSFVGRGRDDESHPEPGITDMLLTAASALGSAVDKGRKDRTLADFYEAIIYDSSISANWIHQSALKALVTNSLFVDSAQIWHMNSEREVGIAGSFNAIEVLLQKNALALKGSKDQKLIDNGGGGMSNTHESENNAPEDDDDDDDDDENEYVELTVLKAKDLPKADVFGSSDPYVVVSWVREEEDNWEEDALLVTAVVMDNLNPVWGEGSGETTTVTLPPDIDADKMLIFEVYDWDRVGEHDLLGLAKIPAYTLLECETSTSLELQLFDPEIDDGDASAGSLLIEMRRISEESQQVNTGKGEDDGATKNSLEASVHLTCGELSSEMEVELSLIACSDLAKIDRLGKPDMFCEVWSLGDMIHRTERYVLNTAFANERISLKMKENSLLFIDVYSGNKGKDAFLGQVSVKGSDVLRPNSEIISYPLSRKNDLPDKLQQHIQGSISLKPKTLRSGQGRVPKMKTLPHEMPSMVALTQNGSNKGSGRGGGGSRGVGSSSFPSSRERDNQSRGASRSSGYLGISRNGAITGISGGGTSPLAVSTMDQFLTGGFAEPVIGVVLDENAERLRQELEKKEEDEQHEGDNETNDGSTIRTIENEEEDEDDEHNDQTKVDHDAQVKDEFIITNEESKEKLDGFGNETLQQGTIRMTSKTKNVKFSEINEQDLIVNTNILTTNNQIMQQQNEYKICSSQEQKEQKEEENQKYKQVSKFNDLDVSLLNTFGDEEEDSYYNDNDSLTSINRKKKSKKTQLQIEAEKREIELLKQKELNEIALNNQIISEIASGQLVDAWLRGSGLAHLPGEDFHRIFMPFKDRTTSLSSAFTSMKSSTSKAKKKQHYHCDSDSDDNDDDDDGGVNKEDRVVDDDDDDENDEEEEEDELAGMWKGQGDAAKVARTAIANAKFLGQSAPLLPKATPTSPSSSSTTSSSTSSSTSTTATKKEKKGHRKKDTVKSMTKRQLKSKTKKSILDVGDKYAIVMNINETDSLPTKVTEPQVSRNQSDSALGTEEPGNVTTTGSHGATPTSVSSSSSSSSSDDVTSVLSGDPHVSSVKSEKHLMTGNASVLTQNSTNTTSSHITLSPETLLGQGDSIYVKSLASAVETGLAVIAERMRRRNDRLKQLKRIKKFCQVVTSTVTQDMLFGASKSSSSLTLLSEKYKKQQDNDEENDEENELLSNIMNNVKKKNNKFGKNINVPAIICYVIGMMKKQLPKHWECNALLSMDGGDYLQHVYSTDNTYIWAGQQLRRSQSVLFDVFDLGYSILVNSIDVGSQSSTSFIPASAKQLVRRESKLLNRRQSYRAEILESNGIIEDKESDEFKTKNFITRIRVAPSTWSSGFAIGNLIDATTTYQLTTNNNSRNYSRRSSISNRSSRPQSASFKVNDDISYDIHSSSPSSSSSSFISIASKGNLSTTLNNDDDEKNLIDNNDLNPIFTFASTPLQSQINMRRKKLSNLSQNNDLQKNIEKNKALSEKLKASKKKSGRFGRQLSATSLARQKEAENEEDEGGDDGTIVSPTDQISNGLPRLNSKQGSFRAHFENDENKLEENKEKNDKEEDDNDDDNNDDESLYIFESIEKEQKYFQEKDQNFSMKKGHWGTLAHDSELTEEEEIFWGSNINKNENEKINFYRKKEFYLKRKKKILHQYTSAVPYIEHNSENLRTSFPSPHRIEDKSKQDYMAVPLASKGSLGIGVLTVRMIRSVETMTPSPVHSASNSVPSSTRTSTRTSPLQQQPSSSVSSPSSQQYLSSELFELSSRLNEQDNLLFNNHHQNINKTALKKKDTKHKQLYNKWKNKQFKHIKLFKEYENQRKLFIKKLNDEKIKMKKEKTKLLENRAKLRGQRKHELSSKKKVRIKKKNDLNILKREKDLKRSKKRERKMAILEDQQYLLSDIEVNEYNANTTDISDTATTAENGRGGEKGEWSDDITSNYENDPVPVVEANESGDNSSEKQAILLKITEIEKEIEILDHEYEDEENKYQNELQLLMDEELKDDELLMLLDKEEVEDYNQDDDEEEDINKTSSSHVAISDNSDYSIPTSASFPTIDLLSGFQNTTTGIPNKYFISMKQQQKTIVDEKSNKSGEDACYDTDYEEEDESEISWQALFDWVVEGGKADTMPETPDEMDSDILDFIRSTGEGINSFQLLSIAFSFSEVLGHTVDTMVKMQTAHSVLGTATALSSTRGEEGSENSPDDTPNTSSPYHNVIIVSIQDLYHKTREMFMFAFPRLISVEIWQLVGEGMKSLELDKNDKNDSSSNQNNLKKSKKSHLLLRKLIDYNEDEFLKKGSIPNGNIDWPKLALEEYDYKYKNSKNLPFKLQSGHMIIPICDPGPKGKYLSSESQHTFKNQQNLLKKKNIKKQINKQNNVNLKDENNPKNNDDFDVNSNDVSSSEAIDPYSRRRHAVVLEGDARFDWNQDIQMMTYYAKLIELHLFRIRRNRDQGTQKLRRVLSAEIDEGDTDDSDDVSD